MPLGLGIVLTLVVRVAIGAKTEGEFNPPPAGATATTDPKHDAKSESHEVDNEQAKVVQLFRRDIIEQVNGKKSSATTLEVTLEPGQKAAPHRHAGPVFGYVLEGQYEHAINEEPVKTYKAGETFYEPTGCLHRVARNPSDTVRTRLLAVILHPADVKEVTTPDHHGRSASTKPVLK